MQKANSTQRKEHKALSLLRPLLPCPSLFISETAFSYTFQASPKGEQHPFSPDHISALSMKRDENKEHHQLAVVLIYHQILRT